jgi:rhamnopyranosyl-N-acetylglucosaminyl-diphospho-decaprenol beta-1,3/1,4-galactofuranosyltransferase
MPGGHGVGTVGAMISIVVLTYNRLHLLRQCVEQALLRTSQDTQEILIWNNASTDGTREYLDSLVDPRFRVIHHDENVGQNAYAMALPLTTQPYFIEMDDDIVDAPVDWDRAMLTAFDALPTIGFLQAKLADDGHSPGADLFYRLKNDLYRLEQINGVSLLTGGPVGGGCTISSRELYDRVGGFRQDKKHVFWHEDAAYIEDIAKLGYGKAILDSVVVVHHGGAHYSEITPEKRAYYDAQRRLDARKAAAKQLLYRIPLVAPLNSRFRWFEPPNRAARV